MAGWIQQSASPSLSIAATVGSDDPDQSNLKEACCALPNYNLISDTLTVLLCNFLIDTLRDGLSGDCNGFYNVSASLSLFSVAKVGRYLFF